MITVKEMGSIELANLKNLTENFDFTIFQSQSLLEQ